MDRREFTKLAATAAALGLTMAAFPAFAQSAPTTPAPLGKLRLVTIPAPDLAAIEHAYAHYLGYRTVWKGTVPVDLAHSWQAPAVAGRRALIMLPESGDATGFRFVEQALPADYRPLTTFGWAAAEILAQDPAELGRRLANSPFRIIGPARPLDGWAGSMAMQVVGPAQEVLYFSHFPPDPAHPDPTAAQRSFVDYVFVGVATTPDMLAATDFYLRGFGNKSYGEVSSPNIIIASANSLPATTMFRMDTVVLASNRMLEIDQAPAMAKPRSIPLGGLAPGIALISFDYPVLNRPDLTIIGKASSTDMQPIAGKATATLRGVGGEMIELIQT
jgi:hypothetical protein